VGFRLVEVTALVSAILHVDGWSTDKKMINVAAGRVVAGVENMQPYWDRAVGQLPCKTVCGN
jgi:hypothetical protein